MCYQGPKFIKSVILLLFGLFPTDDNRLKMFESHSEVNLVTKIDILILQNIDHMVRMFHTKMFFRGFLHLPHYCCCHCCCYYCCCCYSGWR